MNNQRILLHGAVNSSNFGDVLFVSLFYSKIKGIENVEPMFMEGTYGISEFNRRETGYTSRYKMLECLKATALVYISGGYFGDDKASIIMSLRRWIRYFLVGECFLLNKKPIVISGVGGGRLTSAITKKSAIRLMKHARKISVRDRGTEEYYKMLMPELSIDVTNDTALSITKKDLPCIDQEGEAVLSDREKVIFLHVTGVRSVDDKIAERIIPAVKDYIVKNPEYSVIIGTDFVPNFIIDQYHISQMLKLKSGDCYRYHSAWQLCALLNKVDVVITCKLHVGIVACALSKSVVSFPIHSYKTKQFYEGIQQGERCISIDDIDSGKALSQIEKFCNVQVHIDEQVRNLANENLEMCRTEIESILLVR